MSRPVRGPSPEALQRLVANAVATHEAISARLGLNPTDLRCLGLIAEEPGLTPTRLAELTGLTTGAITGVLDRLEESGYVRRRPDPADRRRLTVVADADRAAEWSKSFDALSVHAAELADAAPPDARPALIAYLDDLASALGQEAQQLRVATRGGMVGNTYLAPMAELSKARLVLATGAPRLSLGGAALGQQVRMVAEAAASRLELRAGNDPEELVRATFSGPPPDVRASGGTVSMRYRRRLIDTRSRKAQVALSRAVPWTVEVSGGITDLDGDLSDLAVEGVDVSGGANHLRLRLGRPSGTARVVLAGGSSEARFSRPAGVGVSLRVRGGVSHLRFDDQRFESAGGELRLQSDDLAGATDRYEIDLSGGVSHLTVTQV